MAEETAGERTESATPRRREKARGKGQVAKSQEVGSFFILAAGASVLMAMGPWALDQLARVTHYLLSQTHFLAPEDGNGAAFLLEGNVEVMFRVILPMAMVMLVAGVGAGVMQVGLKVTPDAMSFKWSRMNPISGIGRFFKKQTFFDLIKNLLKIGMIALLATVVIRRLWPGLSSTAALPLMDIVDVGRDGYQALMAVLLAFLAALAVMDWVFQRHQHEEQLKMSKQEMKEEHKEVDGDPQIKARIRAQQMEIARRRMMADVPKADVVITNPTHLAVAIKYEPGAAAPVVVAKGADTVAARIREVARESRVPVIENKPVARALYAEVEVGRTIPESLFQTVAEILAYVYRLKKA